MGSPPSLLTLAAAAERQFDSGKDGGCSDGAAAGPPAGPKGVPPCPALQPARPRPVPNWFPPPKAERGKEGGREDDLAGRRRFYGKLTDMGGSRKQLPRSGRAPLTACAVMRNNRAAAIAAAAAVPQQKRVKRVSAQT